MGLTQRALGRLLGISEQAIQHWEFELSIFRDSSFKIPWFYTLVMFAIGLLYFLFMFLTRRDVLKALPLEREIEVPAAPPESQSDSRT